MVFRMLLNVGSEGLILMGKKYVTTRPSQAKSSRKRYLEEVKRTEEDIQPSDIEQWKIAEAKRNRKNAKRLAHQ